ncbi:MAG TPA: hypothetical protein VG106_11245, partial [Vicinamibacterales bacterium]|nr:hypothetical protein [Vicinamibacterales bacterium]
MAIWTAARRLLPLLALLIVTTPARLDACTCVGDIPLCESFWAADAVFEGEVTAVERLAQS